MMNKFALAVFACVCLVFSSVNAQLVYFNGFETDTQGWFDGSPYGGISRVSSGSGGITSAAGSWHALVEDLGDDNQAGPFTRFDGYRDTFPSIGWYAASVDVYLDIDDWANGFGFDYSVASSGSDGAHQRDFIFHVTKDIDDGMLRVGGSNNTNFYPREDLASINNYKVTQSGWYTFQHYFRNNSGILAVDLNLYDSLGNLLFTETSSDGSDTIPAEVGGNRYGWFTTVGVNGGTIAIDNVSLMIVPEPSTYLMFTIGLLGLGFISRRRMKKN